MTRAGPARPASRAGFPVARKRFGQHFLVDPAVVDAIVAAIDPQPGQALVEIGPGHGALTRPVLARAGALTAIEVDRDLAARWRGVPGLALVEGDALRVDYAALAAAAGSKLRVFGNLPYNVSTPLLFALLAAGDVVADQHFMLQKEVVDRIAARPGGKDYGRLTVMLQWRYAVEAVLDVELAAFAPPPRVRSAVVRMRPLPRDASVDADRLAMLVALAFSQRRKLLRHTVGARLAADGVDGGFDLQRRAEEVPVAEYVALARRAVASRA